MAATSQFEAGDDARKVEPLRKLLADAYPDGRPKVLDCFAGGGAIPLESLRLGCDTTALDLNPVAYLIQKACLEYPQRFGRTGDLGRNQLAEDFLFWAAWIRDRVASDLDIVFPSVQDGRRPNVYFWCRTIRCPDPGCQRAIPLVSSRWLANSTRRKAWIEFHSTSTAISVTVHTTGAPTTDPKMGTIRASSATCPACGAGISAAEVRQYGKRIGFGEQLYAVLDVVGRNRTYRVPTQDEIDGALVQAEVRLQDLPDLEDGTSGIPDEPCDAIGYINLQNLVFGFDTWKSLFNKRQLFVLGRLALAVREAHREMLAHSIQPEYARALATYLAFLVDKIADYDSSFTSWVPTGEFQRDTFPRQAISMVWDYVETDPFGGSDGGIWANHMRWIELAICHASNASPVPAQVLRGNAQTLPFDDATFDAVIVDPPYYISVMYSDLSDFFYVWLKRSIGPEYPGLFATQWTPKDEVTVQVS